MQLTYNITYKQRIAEYNPQLLLKKYEYLLFLDLFYSQHVFRNFQNLQNTRWDCIDVVVHMNDVRPEADNEPKYSEWIRQIK